MSEAFLQYLPGLPAFTLLAAGAFLGGIMRGFSGFGGGLLMAPVYALIMPPSDVVVVILVLNIATTYPMLKGALRDVDWPMVWRVYLPSLIGLPIGLALLTMIDPDMMRRTIAGMVSLLAVCMLAGWAYEGRRGRIQDAVAGVASGFMTAIGGIGGPPLVLYLLSDRSIRPTVFRAFCLAYFALANVGTLTTLSLMGAVQMPVLLLCAALLPIYVVANTVGSILHRRAAAHQEALVRRLCLLFLLAIGILMLLI